jgi:hypothetical protein
VTLDGLWEALHLWIVDDYMQSLHHIGEEKDVPVKRWLRALEKDFAPRLPPSRNDLLVLVSRTTTRTVRPHGIEFENLYYQNDALAELRSRLDKNRMEAHKHGEKPERHETIVQVKYHPGDLGRIWVLDPVEKQYIEVEAVNQEYAQGLSLWKHRAIKRFTRQELKREVDDEALILARARLQARLGQEFRVARTLYSRIGSARFLDMQISCWIRGIPSPSLPPLATKGLDGKRLSLVRNSARIVAHEQQAEEGRTTIVPTLVEHAPPAPPLVSGVTLLNEPVSNETYLPPSPPEPYTETPQQKEHKTTKKKNNPSAPAPTADPVKHEPVVDFSQFGMSSSYIQPERVN